MKSGCGKALLPQLKRLISLNWPELEKEKLEEENKLLRAKTEALQAAKNTEEIYAEAIKAMRVYNGQDE